jgi:hypothetical protein
MSDGMHWIKLAEDRARSRNCSLTDRLAASEKRLKIFCGVKSAVCRSLCSVKRKKLTYVILQTKEVISGGLYLGLYLTINCNRLMFTGDQPRQYEVKIRRFAGSS